jgi:hypothetical protein
MAEFDLSRFRSVGMLVENGQEAIPRRSISVILWEIDNKTDRIAQVDRPREKAGVDTTHSLDCSAFHTGETSKCGRLH